MLLETRVGSETNAWPQSLPTDLDSERTAVFAFGAPGLPPDALLALRSAFPRASMIGCSSAGEIHQASLHDRSLVVAIARFDSIRLRVASVPTGEGEASYAAGEAIARTLATPDLRSIFVLSEGIHVNGSELARGISSRTPEGVSITGGLAGDGERFQRTWVWDGKEVAARRVVAIGLYGERLRVTHGSKGGWDIFGPERRVTRSTGNVLYELDGRPALKLYKEYLGDRAAGLPATALLFPLAVRADSADGDSVVRTILAVNESDQSLTFAGDVPEGAFAQLMRANFDRLVQGAADAGSLAKPPLVDGPTLSLAVSCVGRRLVLGERTEDEVEAALEALPPGARQVGFYSYGELSPFVSISPRAVRGACALHNQTMTLTTFSEAGECS